MNGSRTMFSSHVDDLRKESANSVDDFITCGGGSDIESKPQQIQNAIDDLRIENGIDDLQQKASSVVEFITCGGGIVIEPDETSIHNAIDIESSMDDFDQIKAAA